jgi:hypothetical protein
VDEQNLKPEKASTKWETMKMDAKEEIDRLEKRRIPKFLQENEKSLSQFLGSFRAVMKRNRIKKVKLERQVRLFITLTIISNLSYNFRMATNRLLCLCLSSFSKRILNSWARWIQLQSK